MVGGGRQTGALGLAERRPGLLWLGAPAAFRGRTRWAERHPEVAEARPQRAAAQAPQAPTLRTRLPDTRLTAHAAWQALSEPGESADPWPAPRPRAAVLQRMGVRWRQVVKATPHKQSQATDAICDHSKNKTSPPCPQAVANACASLGKRRCRWARLRAAVSRGATIKPGRPRGVARSRMARGGAWMKRAPRGTAPWAGPPKRVTASSRRSQPRGTRGRSKRRRLQA
jgi:hypothetical protein